jgi:PAS domain-containing protein
MHRSYKSDFPAATTQAGNESAFVSELDILRDVLKLLPTGVTVQDERGDYLLVNDAAAALLQMAATASAPSQLTDRRETCLELLYNGRAAVLDSRGRFSWRTSSRRHCSPARRAPACRAAWRRKPVRLFHAPAAIVAEGAP